MLNTLSARGNRLHRQYPKTVDHLRYIQAERKKSAPRTIQQACGVLQMYKRKGLPFDPAEHGFVFSKDELEAHSKHLVRLHEALHYEFIFFESSPLNAKHPEGTW